MLPTIKPSTLSTLLDAPFKSRKSLPARLEETKKIKSRFPSKVPVVVERYRKEQELPPLDKTKFLVPEDISISQFSTIIRNRMSIKPSQAFFLMVNKKSMMTLSQSMAEVYEQESDEDGFLYMIYCSQEGFGGGREEEVVEEVVEEDAVEDAVEEDADQTEAGRDSVSESAAESTSTPHLSKPSSTSTEKGSL